MTLRPRPLRAALALAALLGCAGPETDSEVSTGETAAAPAPTTVAQWAARAREAVRAAPLAFELTELENDTVLRTGRLAVYPTEGRPIVDLAWSDGSTLRSDGETVFWREADGGVLYSPWSEAGSILFGRGGTRLLGAALDPSSFAAYGGELTDAGADAIRLRAPLPSGGAWIVLLSKESFLPRSASFQAAADAPVGRLDLVPAGEPAPAPASELRIAPESGAEAERFYAGPAPGDPAPEVTFDLTGGGTVSIGDLRGSVVVVDFWATWCAPCKPAMKRLEELYARHADDGLAVYGLRVFDSGDASAYLEGIGVTYPIGDGSPLVEPYAIDAYGLPVLYVIDREGTIAGLLVGYSEATEAALTATVARAVGR